MNIHDTIPGLSLLNFNSKKEQIMKIYEISCVSDCGSYFVSYLQSVVVIANSEIEAISIVKKWFDKSGKKFIYPETKWQIDRLGNSDSSVVQVIDYNEESDY